MILRMLHFSDLQRQPIHVQLFAFADAYLDSAEVVSERLCEKHEGTTYANGAVAMSLVFHSLELFFKAGILRLHPEAQFRGRSGHDLDALSRRFFKLYPKKEFQFEVPFRRELPEIDGGIGGEELAALRAFIAERERDVPEDQRHRYPIDVDGKPWRKANFGFEPNLFLSTLRELRDVYARVWPLLNTG